MAATDARLGSVFGGYRVDGVLGRGGSSVVYRATELRLEREVALKLLVSELGEDARFRKRFLREPKVAASLDHPNIVPVYAAGEVDGQLYIAMRLVEGGDLKRLLHDQGRLPPARAVSLLAQVGSALDTAHVNGLVHRDVKPSNVLIEQDDAGDEHVYLADFGLTKLAGPGRSATRTATGELLGTIDYMAPEQIRGQEVDGCADVYSLGCLLYECLTGEPPFQRGSDVATIYAHLHDPPPRVSERLPVLPAAIDPIITRALAKDPADRYPTCAELVEQARAALGLPAQSTERPWRRKRRRRLALLSSGLVLAAAALATTLALSGGSGEKAAAAIHHRIMLRDFRVTASAIVSTGAPGAHPAVGLQAITDNGRGPVGVHLNRPPGEVVFRFDSRYIPIDWMNGTPSGTRLGYYTNGATAAEFFQWPLTKTGLSPDPGNPTGEPMVRAEIAVPPQYVTVAGRAFPITIRERGNDLIVTVNLQKIERRVHARGVLWNYNYSGVYFRGTFLDKFGGLVNPATNPTEPTTFHASVLARECANDECSRLDPPARDAITMRLPKQPSVLAPRRALYGQPATFTGTGVPGDVIEVQSFMRPGSGPVCTSAVAGNAVASNLPGVQCAPRFGPAPSGPHSAVTVVRSDGTWSLRMPLKAEGYNWRLSGRYVAFDSNDPFWGGSNVLVEAPADTVVALAKPALTLQRRPGGMLAARISVKGGDGFVRYKLVFRGKQLGSGPLGKHGSVTTEIPAPKSSGRLVATVSVPGAESATSSVAFGTGTAAVHRRVVQPGYRVTLAENITDGAPGARPIVGLYAVVDNAKGLPVGQPPSGGQTGEVVFRFDPGQISANNLEALPAGRQIGYFVFGLDRSNAPYGQLPITKTRTSRNPATNETVISGSIALPSYLRLGRTIPLTIRASPDALIATVDLRRFEYKQRATGGVIPLIAYSLYLLPTNAARTGQTGTQNPSEPTTFHASVSARQCANDSCTRLDPPASDTIAIKLPTELTVQAPIRAHYGQPANFTGTGVPGDLVTILFTVNPGSGPECFKVGFRAGCAPAFGPAWTGSDALRTAVRSDHTWSLTVPMNHRLTFERGPTGFFSAVEFPDHPLRGSYFGGATNVYEQAPFATVVALTKPIIRLKRKGGRLAVMISIKGGDDFLRYELRFGGKHVASGHMRKDGTGAAEIPVPKSSGQLVATVSAPGVESATRSIAFHV